MINKVKNCTLLTICIILLQSLASSAILSEIKCSVQDSYCLTKKANIFLKTLAEGSPELGIAGLQKYYPKNFNIDLVGLKYRVYNLEIEGLQNAVIDNFNLDMDFKIMTLSFNTSYVFNSDYTADGFVFNIPVVGNGRATIKFNNVTMEMLILFDIIQNEKGNDVISLKEYFFGVDIMGNVDDHYEHMYNDNKKNSEKLHSMLNKNWRTLMGTFGHISFRPVTDGIFNAMKDYFSFTS